MRHPFRILILPVLAFAAEVAAFDLTPDRGKIAGPLLESSSNTSWLFRVFNVGKDNWGPTFNCNYAWGTTQWRGQDGKRIGSTATKTSSVQYDMTQITNGWFTPNPQVGNLDCDESHISRGWQDTYGGFGPTWPASSNQQVTFHARVDPHFRYGGDENRTNNEVWITMWWSTNQGRWATSENLVIPVASPTLVATDSLFYGAYSTNSAHGNITLTGSGTAQNRVHSLEVGNQKLGYQGRRMQINLSGGAVNRYIIREKAVVTAEFLGQNVY